MVVVVPHEGAGPPGFQSWLVAVPTAGEPQRVRLLAQCSNCSATAEIVGEGRIQYVEGRQDWPSLVRYELTLDPPSVLRVSASSNDVPILDAADLIAFEQGGWRSTGLGDCAAVLGRDGDSGGSAPTASARVLATSSAIYVEVNDGAFSATASSADALDLWFCAAEGKPTSCENWTLTMDGRLLVSGPPRLSTAGKWSESKRWRNADVATVSPTLRRFRLKPLPRYTESANFAYRKAVVGGESRTMFDAHLELEPQGTSFRCVADSGTLRPVPVGQGGAGAALIP